MLNNSICMATSLVGERVVLLVYYIGFCLMLGTCGNTDFEDAFVSALVWPFLLVFNIVNYIRTALKKSNK